MIKPTYNFKKGMCPTCFETKRDVITTAELALMHKDPILNQLLGYLESWIAEKKKLGIDISGAGQYSEGYHDGIDDIMEIISCFPEIKSRINMSAKVDNDEPVS